LIKVTPILPKSLTMFAPAGQRKALERVMEQGTATATGEIKAITRDWNGGVAVDIRRQGDIILILVADARWIYNDQGTRPHLITPKSRTFLKFEAGGGTVFTKRVNHPGTKAQYLNKRVQAKVDALRLAATFSNIIRELTR
jgi:hypothetical protein